jgi:putative PIN family toxin of toxin-antitoxin system
VSASIVGVGPSARIFDALRRNRFVLITSQSLIEECQRAIRRPHIAKKYKNVAERGAALVEFVRTSAVVTSGTIMSDLALRDPKDTFILSCAVEGKADYIVSGDADLTDLETFQGIPILAPAEFVRRFKL